MKIEGKKKKKGSYESYSQATCLGDRLAKNVLKKGKKEKEKRLSGLNKTNELYRRENSTNNLQFKKKKKKTL